MNSDPADRKLQRLFDASRAEDARGAPAFDEVVSSGRAAPRTAIRWTRLAAAAAAVVVLGVSLVLLHPRSAPQPVGYTQGQSPAADLKQWAAVSDWRASTDPLLSVSSLSWESRISAPTDSLINAVSGETATTSKN